MSVRIAFLTLALLPLSLYVHSYGDFDVAATPRWVESAHVDYAVPVAADKARYGLYDLLNEHQVRVVSEGSAQYYRTVRKVLSSTGIQNAAEVSVDFDPSYQKLVLHDIVIIRDGRRIDALDPEAVRIIEKEDDADQSIYDGQLTALVFLKDVRVGDVLDYSWSLEGANPILHGHYADEYDLSSTVPSRLIRHRLVWPAGRPLRFKGAISPTIEKRGEQQIMTWERRDVAALHLEDATPTWYEPWQSIEVTDFTAWSDVVRWADQMFVVTPESRVAVHALAEKIRGEHPHDSITAAIRFVQDDIRYLGIEIGSNSHEPRQPVVILEQRWGDCKEKALLLSMLLRELGLRADPALVSTRLRQKLDARLPSPFAFDHVIVRVIDRGRTSWIDPTIAYQGGTVGTIDTPDDRRALVVSPDTTALAAIQTGSAARTLIEETFVSRDPNSPTMLQVRTTYKGSDADALRAVLATLSTADLARERMNRHAADHPEIASAAPPQITDDRARNVLVITERYAIRNLWKNRSWTFYPRAIEPYLEKPETVIRSMPLAIDHPLDITHRATFIFPSKVKVQAKETTRSTPALRFASRVRGEGRRLTAEYSLRAVNDSVDTRKIPQHLATLSEIRDGLGVRVEAPFDAAVQLQSTVNRVHPLLMLAGVALAGLIGFLWRRLR